VARQVKVRRVQELRGTRQILVVGAGCAGGGENARPPAAVVCRVPPLKPTQFVRIPEDCATNGEAVSAGEREATRPGGGVGSRGGVGERAPRKYGRGCAACVGGESAARRQVGGASTAKCGGTATSASCPPAQDGLVCRCPRFARGGHRHSASVVLRWCVRGM